MQNVLNAVPVHQTINIVHWYYIKGPDGPFLLTAKYKMRIKEVKKLIKEDEQLDEIAMSPSSLRAMASKIDARAGMEFEMYVPDTERDSDDYFEQEPDYEYNESAYDIQQIADFFHDGDYNGRRQIQEFQSRMEEAYFEWRDNKVSELWDEDGFEFYVTWVANNIDEVDIKEWLGKVAGKDLDDDYTPGKQDILDYANYLWGEDDDSKHNAYEEFREEHENDFSDEDWLSEEGVRDMDDAMRYYGDGDISWPYWTQPDSGGTVTIEEVAEAFGQAVGKPCKAGGSYHSVKKRPDANNQFYIVETDGSLSEPDDSADAGLEFVSPAMPIEELFTDLKKIQTWMKETGCYTNESTGLHMNVSVPGWGPSDTGKGGTLDYVKLVLLIGDQYVLDEFGRAGNNYCASGLENVQRRIKTNTGLAEPLLNQMKGHLNDLASKALGVMSTSKYTSANVKDGYVEFRSPGGDWLKELESGKNKIENTMLRFVVALDAATNPEKFRQEYLKKLYKLLAPSGEKSTIEYFARYVAGELPKAALRSFVKQAQLERKIKRQGEQFWWRVDHLNKSAEVVAGTEQEALALAAKEWGVTPDYIKSAEVTNLGRHAYNDLAKPIEWAVTLRPEVDPDFVRYVMAPSAYIAGEMVRRSDPGLRTADLFANPSNRQAGVNMNNAPVRGTTSPRPLPPSDPRGNWVVLSPRDREVVYRFHAETRNDAESIKWSWCNANGATDPDIYRLEHRATETPTQQTVNFGRQYNIFRGMDSSSVVATFVADTDQEAIARLARYQQENPGAEYNLERATNTNTRQPAGGGNFTGWWKIINSDGVELHRFNGVGNVQSDANNVARDWIRQNPQYAHTGLNVVPVMT